MVGYKRPGGRTPEYPLGFALYRKPRGPEFEHWEGRQEIEIRLSIKSDGYGDVYERTRCAELHVLNGRGIAAQELPDLGAESIFHPANDLRLDIVNLFV